MIPHNHMGWGGDRLAGLLLCGGGPGDAGGQLIKHELALCSMGCSKQCIASRSQKVIIPLHPPLLKLRLESNFRLPAQEIYS